MIITRVTVKHLKPFEALMPTQTQKDMVLPGWFCLGAIPGGADSKTAAGVLVFEIADAPDHRSPEARLHWIYVAEKHRLQGVGEGLMDGFYKVLNAAGVTRVVCDVPLPEEYDPLCEFLERWNLEFQLQDRFEAVATVGELEELDAFRNRGNIGPVLALKGCPPAVVRAGWKAVLSRTARGGEERAKVRLEECDSEVSCALIKDSQVEALLLVKRTPAGVLEPVLLRGVHPEADRELLRLLRFGLRAAAKRYSRSAQVRVVCHNRTTARLVAWFMPEKEPLLVRQGMYVEENGDE